MSVKEAKDENELRYGHCGTYFLELHRISKHSDPSAVIDMFQGEKRHDLEE